MMRSVSPHIRSAGAGLLLALLLALAQPTRVAADEVVDWNRALLLPRALKLDLPPLTEPQDRSRRLRLFRITPGFISEPVGLEQDDPTFADPKAMNSPWP